VQSLDIACRVSRYRASVQEPLGLLHTRRGNACRAAEVDAYEKAICDWLSRNGSGTEPLESKTVIGHRVAALPLCRFAASCVPEP